MTANSTCTDARYSKDAPARTPCCMDAKLFHLSQTGRAKTVIARPVLCTQRPGGSLASILPSAPAGPLQDTTPFTRESIVYTARADRSLAASIALAGLSNVAPVFTLTKLALATGGGIAILNLLWMPRVGDEGPRMA